MPSMPGSVNPESTFRSPGSFLNSWKPTCFPFPDGVRWFCGGVGYLKTEWAQQEHLQWYWNNCKGLRKDILWFRLHLLLEQREGNMRWVVSQGDVSVFVSKSKVAWVGWPLMIPWRGKAKCPKEWKRLALHAWSHRQLHSGRGNNGEEIQKQWDRKSSPFLPSVWAERL